ncbi:MAG: primosomal protein N' [Clostridia bacterium]|nr:primosomal protein N' [Clostridia bacterium]
MSEHLVAGVVPLRSARATDRAFDYICDGFDLIKPGSIVKIPFGTSESNVYGLVLTVEKREPEMTLKSVDELLDDSFSLPEELLGLCSYMRKQCFCTLSDAARTLLPSGIRLKTKIVYTVCDPEAFMNSAQTCPDGEVEVDLEDSLYRISEKEAARLIKAGLLTKTVRFLDSVNEKTVLAARLVSGIVIPDKTAAKYADLISLVGSAGEDGIAVSEVCSKLGISRSPIKTLFSQGVIEVFEKKIDRSFFSGDALPDDEIELNDEQNKAFSEIADSVNEKKADAFMLYGVTGSGKTKVLIKTIDEVLKSGRSVIYLVPEISLTSQSYRLLSKRYKENVCVIHSGLSEGERIDAWFAVKNGSKKVVLGTRSAVFAPCPGLGAIILDEEHDQSFKSDSSPRYHARDIARYRCAKNNAVMILSSATPDVESFYKAKCAKYKLLTLPHRYSSAPLPEVKIVDLRPTLREDPERLIGPELESQIELNLENGEQTILFVDRRGYNKFVSCIECANVPVCPNCSVSLTLHSQNGRTLVCHYCGHREPAPKVCPKCGSTHLMYHGYGSQKAEEEIKKAFPDARILRMDADSVSQKNSHEKLLGAFRNREADILLGTQMVAKGHDFPFVTLVGVVMADTSLYMSDYRAYEHSFSLLTQVIGRAGRGELPGRAYIQTLNPYHEVLRLCTGQDYLGFYENEIALRKALVYPPFCSVCLFGFSGEDESVLDEAMKDFSQTLSGELKKDPSLKLIVYGPMDAPIYRLNGVYRKRFVIKYRQSKETSSLFSKLLGEFDKKYRQKLKIYIDINPSLI